MICMTRSDFAGAVFIFASVKGSVVAFGLLTLSGNNVPAYHLHFKTNDRKADGHILEIQVESATAQLDATAGFAIEPLRSGDFL